MQHKEKAIRAMIDQCNANLKTLDLLKRLAVINKCDNKAASDARLEQVNQRIYQLNVLKSGLFDDLHEVRYAFLVS